MPATGALSYSSYRTYLECPLRWKFLYVEHRPEAPRGYFTFGRVIHSVLEELVRPFVVPAPRRPGSGDGQKTLDDWSPGSSAAAPPRAISPEELVQVYDRSWSGEGYTSAEEEARYRALGRDLLMRFHAQFVKHPVVPVAVEEHLETRWDGIPIHGYIDRIDRTPTGGLEIVDYKTSRELSAEDARDSDQLSLYQVLVENNYAEPVERVTLLHLRSLVPHRAPARTRTTLDPLHARLGMVADGIREQAFEPTPGTSLHALRLPNGLSRVSYGPGHGGGAPHRPRRPVRGSSRGRAPPGGRALPSGREPAPGGRGARPAPRPRLALGRYPTS